MRRAFWFAACAGLVGLAALVGLMKAAQPAHDDGSPGPSTPTPTAAQLPISRVVLYSSGVGYFQRQGTVDGDARIDLSFPAGNVNDLLKSMVLQDLDGGHVAAVSYDSNAPVEHTLKSFAINLTGSPTFAQILTQARGERVEVALAGGGAGAARLNGTVVGMDIGKAAVGKDAVDVPVLNLWCADGLRAVKLSNVQRVRFVNPVIEAEFKKALETLALSHDTQKKAVSIRCSGEGKRRVRVGYVIENPIWKTSYRLVLGAHKGDKPYLQGWAVVENPSDEDWKDVRMALVSGRPISFQMDLYQPLYVPRPTVVPELFASLGPVAYNAAIDVANQQNGAIALRNAQQNVHNCTTTMPAPTAPVVPCTPCRAHPSPAPGAADGAWIQQRLQLQRGVSSGASAAKLGDFFRYAIDHPVSLPRQKSALLPIVGKNVEGTRVAIYNEATHAKYPLLGLKLKNTSGLHLMQGPITVFEGSAYAGDARIQDLQPNEERLLSYAVDLGTEVAPNVAQVSSPERLTKVKLYRGILQATTRERMTKTYRARNRSEQDRLLLIEHPYNPAFTLAGNVRPRERTAQFYRFEVELPAGKTVATEVIEERDVQRSVQITNGDTAVAQFMVSSTCSDKVKAVIRDVQHRQEKLGAVQRELAEVNQKLQALVADQGRLRANLKEVPASSAAYKRYLAKFDTQETEIEKLQDAVNKLSAREAAGRAAYEAYLASLDVE
jgi:hypothetical protein